MPKPVFTTAKSKATAKPAKVAKPASPAPLAIQAKPAPVKKGKDYAPHWSPLQTDIFDFIRFANGSAIVEAVAGSGKTSTICEGVRYMQGAVCALAFNRSIAKELKERLAPFQNVKAGTVHSIGLQAIRANVPHLVKVEKDKLKWIFEDLLKTETNWQAQAPVCKLVSMAKDAGAGIDFLIDDVEAWQKLAEHFSIPLSVQSKKGDETFDIVAMAQKLLKLSNEELKPIKNGKTMLRVDFSDMIYLPVLWNLPLEKFAWVIVDEAQDLNLTRRLFIKGLSSPATRHLIVGDTSQAIYGFTGADARSMENMRATFNCTPFPLSICYRCASSVIEYAQKWMPSIEASPSAPLGEVLTLDYAKAMDNLTAFAPADVILCRNNAPIVKTAMTFIRANISVRVEGNDLTGKLCELANEHKKAGALVKVRASVLEASDERIADAQAKGKGDKAGQIKDLAETLCVFIGRAIETGATFEEMIALIKGFFSPADENGEARDVLTLSTIHKSKGREWGRVFWLAREQFQPSKFAKKEWELTQENNLCYVAATRAKLQLVELTNYPVNEAPAKGGEE